MKNKVIERTKLFLYLFIYLNKINREIVWKRKISTFLEKERASLQDQTEEDYDARIEFLNRTVSFIDDLVNLVDSICNRLNREQFGRACLELQEFIFILEENKAEKTNFLISLKEGELYLRKFILPPAQA